jgi:hypothetical protein
MKRARWSALLCVSYQSGEADAGFVTVLADGHMRASGFAFTRLAHVVLWKGHNLSPNSAPFPFRMSQLLPSSAGKHSSLPSWREAHERAWVCGFAALQAYRRRHANTWPKATYRLPDGFRLGSWCVVQRLRRKQGWISRERIARLDAIGFPWNLKNDLWARAYPALKSYRRVHPEGWPSKHYVTRDALKLGAWCTNARFRMKSGQMPEQRVRQLRAIGFR